VPGRSLAGVWFCVALRSWRERAGITAAVSVRVVPGMRGSPGKLVLLRQITASTEEPRVSQSAMPVVCRVLVAEVPAVPDVLARHWPARCPAGSGRAAGS
jgi:hypothetical protein